ncbi:MAG TPA: polysaccharide deacetylase family protein [Bacteriovoracaceae bacterium]|nr:polysaccharide deacetylase family protein [Bacteriovoracaceae bacterium]
MLWSIFSFLFVSQVYGQTCSLNSYQHLSRPVLESLRKELSSCPANKVHLTFDDGPHPRYTSQIREELNRRGVKASFFVTTKNLEGRSSHEARSMVQSLLKDGHLIANHGYEHNAYALRMDGNGKVLDRGFSESEREYQLNKSTDLLNQATGHGFSNQKHLVFRFPYGRGAMPSPSEIEYMHEKGMMTFSGRNYQERLDEYRRQSPALVTLASQNFSHLGWNHDSKDTSAVSLSDDGIRNYIKENLKDLCKGRGNKVSLFHDIKEVNTKAIGPIIDIGRCLGLEFISYDELAKNKTSLNKGVLISKEDVELGVYESMEDLLKAVNKAGVVDCKEENVLELGQSCYSDYTKSYFANCEGESSICYEGRWYSKNDSYVQNKCKKKCFSEYTKSYFNQCAGETSICFDGKWYSRNHQLIKNNCRK